MESRAFFAELERGEWQRIYLLHGEEEFAKDRAVDAMVAAVTPDLRPFNVDLLDNPDLAQLMAAARSMPMMAERRIVLARDARTLTTSETEAKALMAQLDDIPASNTVALLLRGKADARKALYKAIDKRGGTVNFAPYSEGEAARWLVQRAKKQQVQLDPAEASQLVMMAGNQLSVLADELDKLCDYAGPGGQIDKDMMQRSVHEQMEYTVFSMLEHFLAGRIEQGFIQLFAALEEEGMGAAMQLNAFFASRLRAMLLAARMLAQGAPLQSVVAAIGGHAYAAKKSVQAARQFSLAELEEALCRLAAADLAIKSGTAPEQALTHALLHIFGTRAVRT